MTKHTEMASQGLTRRALLGRASATGLLALTGPTLTLNRARAVQCARLAAAPDRTGQTIVPQPAGEGMSMVETDCIPNHAVGPYFTNDAQPQPTAMQLFFPSRPTGEQLPTPVGDHIFGVGINGVPFERIAPTHPSAAAWEYNVHSPDVLPHIQLDANNGRLHSNGQYHYVGSPLGLVCGILDQNASASMLLLGWAADGFPIYADVSRGPLVDDGTPLAHTVLRTGYRIRSGRRPEGSPGGVFDGTFAQDYAFLQGAGDLDECNGRFGATPEYPSGTYYYVITRTFPFLPLSFRGKPHPSFATASGPMPVPARLAAYAGKLIDDNLDVPASPASDAVLLRMPPGLASAQTPLVMDRAGYRYFLAICSLDGQLYYSSASVDGERGPAASWQIVPQQPGFTTVRPGLTMLSGDEFQISIAAQSGRTKLTTSTNGSLDNGTIRFEAWRST